MGAFAIITVIAKILLRSIWNAIEMNASRYDFSTRAFMNNSSVWLFSFLTFDLVSAFETHRILIGGFADGTVHYALRNFRNICVQFDNIIHKLKLPLSLKC